MNTATAQERMSVGPIEADTGSAWLDFLFVTLLLVVVTLLWRRAK